MKSTVVKRFVVSEGANPILSQDHSKDIVHAWLSTEHGRWVYERAATTLKIHHCHNICRMQNEYAITAYLSPDDQLIHLLTWE